MTVVTKETFLSEILSIIKGEKDYATFGDVEIEAYDGLDFIEGLPSLTLVDGNKIGLSVEGSDLYFKLVDITDDQIGVISEVSKEFKKFGINTNNR